MELKLSTLVQYAFLLGISYILIVAPLLRSLFGSPSFEESPEQLSVEKIESLVIPDPNLKCPEHSYSIRVFSRDPLVIYITSFLSVEEADHLVKISEPHFTPSTVWTGSEERLDPSVRFSEKAPLDRSDLTVQCLEERARVFQGWRPHVFIEKLWSQRYGPGGHYRHHYDWGSASARSGRISSFMVYLDANCTGGGTNFPRLTLPQDRAWCEFVECRGTEGQDDAELLEGVTFKPIKGSAVYWENFREDGTGYEESWHAGLPVKNGTKVGLNIWSWYQADYRPTDIIPDQVQRSEL